MEPATQHDVVKYQVYACTLFGAAAAVVNCNCLPVESVLVFPRNCPFMFIANTTQVF